MREAVGSTFLFKVMIVFIFFFTAFLAIAINYAQAFKAKNQIINALEQSEGYNEKTKERIEQIQKSSGYFRNGIVCSNYDNNDNKTYFSPTAKGSGVRLDGICIAHTEGSAPNSGYYTVRTFIHFDFPIIGDIATIPVTGETKLIVNDSCSESAC